MRYYNGDKNYEVDDITFNGAIVNVNGTSITDLDCMRDITGNNMYGDGYTVFVDSDELWFETFDEAYDFAMNKQKDTFSL